MRPDLGVRLPSLIIINALRKMAFDVNPFSKVQSAQIDAGVLERLGILVGVPSAFAKITGVQVA